MNHKKKGPTLWELARQALSSTRRGYDLLAPKFDHTLYATPLEWIESSLKLVEESHPVIHLSETVGADLACGTGRGARALKAYCERVEGFDFSAGMLAQAEEKSSNLRGLSWIQTDLAELHLEPRTYDRIVSYGAWGHILPTFRSHFLQQILWGLKPGGVFLTLTADRPGWWEKRFWFHLFFDLAISLRNRMFPEEFHMYYRLNSTEALIIEFNKRIDPAVFELSCEPLPECPELPLTLLTVHRRS